MMKLMQRLRINASLRWRGGRRMNVENILKLQQGGEEGEGAEGEGEEGVKLRHRCC